MISPHDTEDAVSETFIRMINYAPAFENTEHEKAWLIRAAVNVCKNELKSARRKNVAIDDYSDVLKTETDTLSAEILEAVQNLPERYKTAVHLYYYEGYSGAEIAAILRKPRSTVLNHLSEARAILRERLGSVFNEE